MFSDGATTLMPTLLSAHALTSSFGHTNMPRPRRLVGERRTLDWLRMEDDEAPLLLGDVAWRGDRGTRPLMVFFLSQLSLSLVLMRGTDIIDICAVSLSAAFSLGVESVLRGVRNSEGVIGGEQIEEQAEENEGDEAGVIPKALLLIAAGVEQAIEGMPELEGEEEEGEDEEGEDAGMALASLGCCCLIVLANTVLALLPPMFVKPLSWSLLFI